jgi:hypothetical protein
MVPESAENRRQDRIYTLCTPARAWSRGRTSWKAGCSLGQPFSWGLVLAGIMQISGSREYLVSMQFEACCGSQRHAGHGWLSARGTLAYPRSIASDCWLHCTIGFHQIPNSTSATENAPSITW